MSDPLTLRALLARLPGVDASGLEFDVPVTALEIDSRKVMPGALFVALRGEHFNGHDFIVQAMENGAVAVLAESSSGGPGGADRPSVYTTLVLVNNTQRALSSIASIFFGDPSRAMRVVGLTGTNGKTTTTHMLAGIFEAAEMPAGVIGTIGAHFRSREWKLANTTPLAPELQKLLGEMRDSGAKAVAMEVSSHALALDRVNDVRFEVGAFTNLTRDHLDFHETFEAYALAKHRLFEMSERCVFNVDDEYGVRWAEEFSGQKPVLTYTMQSTRADLVPSDIELRGDGSVFVLDGMRFEIRIPGSFNVSNALCAIACARLLGIDDTASARGLATIDRVRGRMEHVHAEDALVDVVIDYAHTPDSLQNALRALRAGVTKGSSLSVVFGCGGNRDRGKRPLMGKIATQLADHVYVTSDNPRSEDPEAIIDEIVAGVGILQTIGVEQDRQKAIERAIFEAKPGDTVLIAGKGHEDYQIIGNTVYPFDDAVIAREALEKRAKGRAS